MKAKHLYVHVPFCARRCVYCDFSIAVRSRVPTGDYLRALDAELSLRHGDSTLGLETVYLGGGTPSKLGTAVRDLMAVLRRHAVILPNAEVTLEVNPEDVSRESARAWRESGVNRVSLGVQSFDDAVLKWMHRTHDAQLAMTAIQVLREEGIDNLSIDLIFATPQSIARSWATDVARALELGLPHFSIYGLTVEPRTPLGRWVARSDVAEAPEESFEQEYLLAHERLTDAGLSHYEVSNFGHPGSLSRHNWAYWTRSPYVGVGPSAHEFDGCVRRWNTDAYAGWFARLDQGEDAVDGSEELSSEQVLAEEAYLGLRTEAGLPLDRIPDPTAEQWLRAGWASSDGSRLRLTGLGWLRLDALVSDLTIVRSRY